MANSRIMLTCKHCGESLCIGKGYFGGYCTVNEKIHEHLNEFYNKHYQGECSDDIDVSDNARNHFVILEEGESLKDLVPTADVVPKSEVESKYGYIHTYTGGHPYPVGDPGVMGWTGCTGCAKNHEVAREIFEEIEELKEWVEAYKNTIASMEKIDEELRAELENVKSEVAREIFEEIYEDCFDQFGYINYEKLAELKKKYTEEKI